MLTPKTRCWLQRPNVGSRSQVIAPDIMSLLLKLDLGYRGYRGYILAPESGSTLNMSRGD